MWSPSRRQLGLAFLLLSALSAASLLLRLRLGLLPHHLILNVLCPTRCPSPARVSFVCLPGPGSHLNASMVLSGRKEAAGPGASVPADPTGSFGPGPAADRLPLGTWTIQPDGRFGNQMGQYATLFALARLNTRRAFILPPMHAMLAPIFRLSLPVLAPEVDTHATWRHFPLHDWMSEDYAHLGHLDPIKFTGFPCSWTFFNHLRAEIRAEFALHDHVREEAQAFLRQVQWARGGQPITFVGVHVRRGDYVQVMPRHWRGVVADRGYLEKALGYFRGRYRNPMFVVTSNGMAWCRENIDSSRGDVVFAGDGAEGSPGRDFALLMQCNHTVMTIGTFGFWAGYLAGGETVYLANFTLPDSEFLKIFKPEAAFLPEWVGIPADLSPLRG
ncbi:galactoside alpha-(1,2)-fucosyltransferase 1 [Ornithorhynchus anatinus]|uniref:galactoside alpha-(1,2)-fucosyltransferase 1 n=1 Tax=Ornithorhynchus anatinus TaxID=9258 RepID=UPI0001554F1F|nr:galactoside alpha-(1,2)-fucosyltransferase 1 [Ornithorhynchus anatinus]XP_028929696.1 galactoside alpha-(1,2)-fucosyltransferase 1 [Ornithorhynchus anatinus]